MKESGTNIDHLVIIASDLSLYDHKSPDCFCLQRRQAFSDIKVAVLAIYRLNRPHPSRCSRRAGPIHKVRARKREQVEAGDHEGRKRLRYQRRHENIWYRVAGRSRGSLPHSSHGARISSLVIRSAKLGSSPKKRLIFRPLSDRWSKQSPRSRGKKGHSSRRRRVSAQHSLGQLPSRCLAFSPCLRERSCECGGPVECWHKDPGRNHRRRQ